MADLNKYLSDVYIYTLVTTQNRETYLQNFKTLEQAKEVMQAEFKATLFDHDITEDEQGQRFEMYDVSAWVNVDIDLVIDWEIFAIDLTQVK
jgi:hypothetical protein